MEGGKILFRKAHHITPHEVVFSRENENVHGAIEKMLQSGFRRLPVADSSRGLVGLITAVDILNFFLRTKEPAKESVRKAMERSVYKFSKDERLGKVAELFDMHRKGGYPVLENRRLYSIITEFDFLSIARPRGIKVSEAMTHRPMVIRPDVSLYDASRIIVKGGTRRLPVVGRGLEGIITPHDILHVLEEHDMRRAALFENAVKAAMIKNVITVSPQEDVRHAASIIAKRRIGGIPVVEKGRLMGIITERDMFSLIKKGLDTGNG